MKITFNEKGNVTLIALILLVILTLIGISANRTSTLDMQIARNEIPYKQNFYIAEGGINIEASEIGKGMYPVPDINATDQLLATSDSTSPQYVGAGNIANHSVGGKQYDFNVIYKGSYLPPAKFSTLKYNRYDYNVETLGGDSDVKVNSRFYTIGKKPE
jgi:hypothetical protein